MGATGKLKALTVSKAKIPRRMRRAEERAKLERMADERQQLAETERKRK